MLICMSPDIVYKILADSQLILYIMDQWKVGEQILRFL